jgi:alpha-tubulin suppressor-like RCC1 family protein
MPNQFLSPEGDLENYFITESWLIDQYVGDTLWSWGRNDYGDLGINNVTTPICTPVTTSAGGATWVKMSSTAYAVAAIKSDGTLWTWGYNYFGQLGTNDTIFRSNPVTTFAGGNDWKQINGGHRNMGAIKNDGTLWVWGNNGYGQLGNNSATGVYTSGGTYTPITTFAGGTNWKQISYGVGLAAAIKTDGTLWTWGRNDYGALGTNDVIYPICTPVTTFAGGTNWKQVSSGGSTNMSAIKTDGTLWVWGGSITGTLYDYILTPVTTFAGGTDWSQLGSGRAIKSDGTLWTWGLNGSGGLAVNDRFSRYTPVTTFAGGNNWSKVFINTAIKTDGTLWTWGFNTSGQLGVNDTTNRSTPVTTFAGGTDWSQVGNNAAIKTDGTLWTWGFNTQGQLGVNDTTNRYTPVTTFAGGTDWSKVYSAGRAIKTDGTLWTWGLNTQGQLGVNDTTDRYTPVTTFAGGTNWSQIGNSNPTRVIKTDGTLWTWGFNTQGQLGVNDTDTRCTPVTTFAGGNNWSQIGGNTAIKSDGTLWTWGSNAQGQLGVNDTTDRYTPVTTFAGGTNWSKVFGNNAAIKTDGTLWVWGNDGPGSSATNNTFGLYPNQIYGGGTNWKKVSSWTSNSQAIKTDGTLWVWGSNGQGQLGVNDTTLRITPVTTFAGGTNWKQTSTKTSTMAAIKTDGSLWTWGRNDYGQLGTNDTNNRCTPVTTFAGGTNWKQVDNGYYHTVALTSGTDPTYFIS